MAHLAMKAREAFLLLMLTSGGASDALAQCQAQHRVTGETVQARERPGHSIYWAHAGWDPDGWPVIIYGPTYFHLPQSMQQLTAIHECMHISVPTSNEFEANCRALLVMRERGLSAQEESYIAQFHINIGPLPPRYGGSGKAFWQGTIQCAGPRR
jgi:hypothetical protein